MWKSLFPCMCQTWDFDCWKGWWHEVSSPPLSVCQDRLSRYCPRLASYVSFSPNNRIIGPYDSLNRTATICSVGKLSKNGWKVISKLVPKNYIKVPYSNFLSIVIFNLDIVYSLLFSPTRPHWAKLVIELLCPCVCATGCSFFRGLSLALRSHDQIPASHWSTPSNKTK